MSTMTQVHLLQYGRAADILQGLEALSVEARLREAVAPIGARGGMAQEIARGFDLPSRQSVGRPARAVDRATQLGREILRKSSTAQYEALSADKRILHCYRQAWIGALNDFF
ncbi:MAG: hypothetical protein EON58_00845 [Alphaproteobacteria bacterium]|nr:MAG: hypothetical protein EON58_00845 [Alphaproteobacteria bacterium]